MYKAILFTGLLRFTIPVLAQQIPERNAPATPESKGSDNQCYQVNHMTAKERALNYPFNQSVKIGAAVFDAGTYLIDNQTVNTNRVDRIADSVILSRIKRIHTLTANQVENLTGLLYNYGFKKATHDITRTACYRPRNALIFFDDQARIIEIVEICFECANIETSSEKVYLGDMCDQKLPRLEKFFNSLGLKTSDELPSD